MTEPSGMQPTGQPRRFGCLLAAGGVLIVALLAAFIAWPAMQRDHHEYRVRLLASAGSIETGRIATSVSADLVCPPGPVPKNAAAFYLAAVNSWNERRLPYLQNRKLNPFADEPMPNPYEIAAVRAGSRCRDCDFYALRAGQPEFAFVVNPGKKVWRFEPAVDPFAMRPYVNIMRLVAQGVLNAGKKLERAGNQVEAELNYQAVVRFGVHLCQHPGSILDLQLGLEVQQKGLHYLDVHYGLARQVLKQRAAWRYGDSLKQVAAQVERKYTQLGNPEAAMAILQRDSEPYWRVQAAAALKLALDVDRYGWLEKRDIRRSLANARQDPDPAVRRAVRLLEARPPTPASTPTPKDENTH